MIRILLSNMKHCGNRSRLILKSMKPDFYVAAPVQLIVSPKLLTSQHIQNFSDQPQKPPEDNFNFDQRVPNLLTIPLVSQRFDSNLLTEEEQKMPEQEYCLFSSNQPIFPNSKMSCQIKIGNLKDINRPLLYCIVSSEKGEMYTVGVALSKNVEQQLGKKLKSQTPDSLMSPQFQIDVMTKRNNYRIKITEIQITNEGIYAKGIPYKDRKLTKNEAEFNIKKVLSNVHESLQDIMKIARYDKVEMMKDLDLSFFDRLDNIKQDDLDAMIYQIAFNLQNNMNLYMKENSSRFVQRLLESRTYIDRVLILQHQVQVFQEAMNIVDRNVRQAENQMSKLQAQQVARLAQEYIRQLYFREPQATPPAGSSTTFGGGQSYSYQQERPQTNSPLIKKYFDKLSLIEDAASREKIRKEIERFAAMDKHSSEYSKIVTYLDEVFSVPWKQFTPVEWDSEYAAKILDEEIYGLEKVKQRILEMIAVNKLKNSDEKSKGFILLLNGPPGTGKTSIAKTIAKCLKRTQRFISFAGVADSHFFKGHRRTYVDSQPGVFVKELIKANTMNPVFILDEVDKISKSTSGSDPYYSLLEILNTEENHNFMDHYLDISTDFSKVVFILTSNSLMSMLEPLQNRLEIIEVSAYIEEEKLAIGKNYIIPKVLELNGIQQQMLIFDDDTIKKVIKGWCYYESGVRELKRQFEKIARKYATEIVHQSVQIPLTNETSIQSEDINQTQQQQKQSISFFDLVNVQKLDLTKDKNLELLQKYLGPPIFDAYAEQRNEKIFPPGQVNILTVAGLVGNVLVVECCFDNSEWEKKGQLTSSGNLKNVLQESLKLAKINAVKYLKEDQIKLIQKNNVHIHFMSGAVPKDGPSAGTAITTALISLASGIQIPSNVSMTGEISLNGNVSKIGGVQQKLIASKTLGINDVILPKTNLGDVLELSKQLMHGMTLYFVDKYDQIFSLIFQDGLKLYKSEQKQLENIIIVKDGIIVTDVGNTIYSNYGIVQQIQGLNNKKL